jgi:hypothetical protein
MIFKLVSTILMEGTVSGNLADANLERVAKPNVGSLIDVERLPLAIDLFPSTPPIKIK